MGNFKGTAVIIAQDFCKASNTRHIFLHVHVCDIEMLNFY